jgi:hypothetical protein
MPSLHPHNIRFGHRTRRRSTRRSSSRQSILVLPVPTPSSIQQPAPPSNTTNAALVMTPQPGFKPPPTDSASSPKSISRTQRSGSTPCTLSATGPCQQAAAPPTCVSLPVYDPKRQKPNAPASPMAASSLRTQETRQPHSLPR